jgi:uncharacterized RDD family membrane protein YckC
MQLKLLLRSFAFIIDWLVLDALTVLIILGSSTTDQMLIVIIRLFLGLGYSFFLLETGIGKKVFQLKTVSSVHGQINGRQALLRSFVKFLEVYCLMFVPSFILYYRKKILLHDYIAKTTVLL